MSVIFPPKATGGATDGAGLGESVGLGDGDGVRDGDAEGITLGAELGAGVGLPRPLDGSVDGPGEGWRLDGIPEGSSQPVRINKVRTPAAKGLRQNLSILPVPLTRLFIWPAIDCSLSALRATRRFVSKKISI